AHGTGTRLGDPAELAGLREVFRASGRGRRLAVGSVKANVGHLEPAAGIVGFVKAALCVEHAHLVPTPNFTTPNPAVPAFHDDFEVLRAARPWPDEAGRPRRAGVSSIGMGGTNAHIVLEQAPSRAEPPAADRNTAPAIVTKTVPLVLSARSEQALSRQAALLHDLVGADPSLPAAAIGHSLIATRPLFEHRAVVLAEHRDEALAGLAAVAAGTAGPRAARGTAGTAGPVVFVFPGQGSQWPGMGRRLYAESEVFARSIDACAKALEPWLDWSLLDLIGEARTAPSLEHGDAVDAVIQPALWAMMVSLAALWRSLGVAPDVVVGHSQGEIAAACAAGALSLKDGARIVALRSQALTALAAVRDDRGDRRDLLDRGPGRRPLGGLRNRRGQ
ncbi:acyltransferase domain-containing protein, partial [Streptomyces sp. NPDC005070]